MSYTAGKFVVDEGRQFAEQFLVAQGDRVGFHRERERMDVGL